MLIHRLIIDGPKQAIYCNKHELARARKAGHVVETRDVYDYLVVAASDLGCQFAVTPQVRTEELALHLLGSTVRKVLHDGTPWPAVTPPPSRIAGHVRNWLAFGLSRTGKLGVVQWPRKQGYRYCYEQGWLAGDYSSTGGSFGVTRAGNLAAIALGVIPEVPYYEVGGVRYTLADLPLPVPSAPRGPDPKASLVARVAELEARVAVLEAGQ